jgi:hypothetical protein
MSTNEQKTIQILLKNKQLLDEIFVISRIIKVEVSVISRAESEIILLYIEFSLITLSTNNDVSHKTTFDSQKKL